MRDYERIPWESFALILTPRARRRAMTARAFIYLCAIALACGSLFAVSQL